MILNPFQVRGQMKLHTLCGKMCLKNSRALGMGRMRKNLPRYIHDGHLDSPLNKNFRHLDPYQ